MQSSSAYTDTPLYQQKGATISHHSPQTAFERSFSPLIEDNHCSPKQREEGETWKLSSTVRHRPLSAQGSPAKTLPRPPEPFYEACYPNYNTTTTTSPTNKKKALPEIPATVQMPSPPSSLPFIQQQPFPQGSEPFYYVQPMPQVPQAMPMMMMMPSLGTPGFVYPPDVQQTAPADGCYGNPYTNCSSNSSTEEEDEPVSPVGPTEAQDFDAASYMNTQETKISHDKNVRQIRVKSINNDYKVWITVEPKETGESIAEKINTIASFRTRKAKSITTASGRKIELNRTPVFKNWEDMDDFENGETWTVTWGPLKKSFMDRVLSTFIED